MAYTTYAAIVQAFDLIAGEINEFCDSICEKAHEIQFIDDHLGVSLLFEDLVKKSSERINRFPQPNDDVSSTLEKFRECLLEFRDLYSCADFATVSGRKQFRDSCSKGQSARLKEIRNEAINKMPGNAGGGKQLVVLVHGIQDYASWQNRCRNVLYREGRTHVETIKYGFFDPLRFWIPGRFREGKIRILTWKLESAMAQFPHDELIIVAHSFGTYSIMRILEQKHHIRPSRLLFCGAIVPEQFNWSQFHYFEEEFLVNECGNSDHWPIIAKIVSWGFGPTGSFGIGHAGVRNRYFNFGHSGFFDESHIESYWKPWIHEGTFVDSNVELHAPWYRSYLTYVPLRWPVALLFVVIALCCLFLSVFVIGWLDDVVRSLIDFRSIENWIYDRFQRGDGHTSQWIPHS